MPENSANVRLRLDLRGQVQGVGFRPYVYRLATELGLGGTVANDSNGAVIEIEGPRDAVAAFEQALPAWLPPLASISSLTKRDLPPLGETTFRIKPSEADPRRRPEVTPDAATCADCLRELREPSDRRHRYAFINCTNCGPRYSIIRGLPYDRPRTTMAVFDMCPLCDAEYNDPADRRFHAQPNACPTCGPQLELRRVVREDSESQAAGTARTTAADSAGRPAPRPQPRGPSPSAAKRPPPLEPVPGDAIRQAAAMLADGKILAVKGIGGYHLACRADREDVVQRLRQRKLRDGKPLALMVADVEAARRVCRLSRAEVDALCSTAAPIVLAPKAAEADIAPSVAPGCDCLGVMLPYAPLHHMLFAEGSGPLVMTSGNLAGHPLTYRDDDALKSLGDVADAFLTHNREVFRPIDDSVVVAFRDQVVPIRRARGYAPRPIKLAGFGPGQPLASVRDLRVLAVGGELKSTVCLLTGGQAVLSEHLGDLTQPATFRNFVRAVERLKDLRGFAPDVVVCDLHPHYLATEYARRLDLPTIVVQHHHAHIASVMAEWGAEGPLVGLACDGTGYGSDRAVWGCEVLLCRRASCTRLGHLEYFPLVGGDAAARHTWRPAAALLRAAFGENWPRLLREIQSERVDDPTDNELRVFERQAAGGLNAPPTSSLGRVFDAASCILGLCDLNRHEAEAAMALEAAASGVSEAVEPFAWEISGERRRLRVSLLPTIREVYQARRDNQPVSQIAARFHESVAHALAEAARRGCESSDTKLVGLSGGCFVNRRLLRRTMALIEAAGLTVLYHRAVPAGDGGISLGQALVAAWQLADGEKPARPGGVQSPERA